jgi:hypothetical protein
VESGFQSGGVGEIVSIKMVFKAMPLCEGFLGEWVWKEKTRDLGTSPGCS